MKISNVVFAFTLVLIGSSILAFDDERDSFADDEMLLKSESWSDDLESEMFGCYHSGINPSIQCGSKFIPKTNDDFFGCHSKMTLSQALAGGVPCQLMRREGESESDALARGIVECLRWDRDVRKCLYMYSGCLTIHPMALRQNSCFDYDTIGVLGKDRSSFEDCHDNPDFARLIEEMILQGKTDKILRFLRKVCDTGREIEIVFSGKERHRAGEVCAEDLGMPDSYSQTMTCDDVDRSDDTRFD